jgi:hypothetical protein
VVEYNADHKSLTLKTVLLRFPVLLVAAATLAEFLELETASGRLLVLGGGVVALFALGALQCHDFPHLRILTDSVRICSATGLLEFPAE